MAASAVFGCAFAVVFVAVSLGKVQSCTVGGFPLPLFV